MTDPTGARMQHDVGADFKVPLPMFSGRNDHWPFWSARFGAYAELVGWTRVLEVAEVQTAPISMVGASLEAIRLGKIIYAVLLAKTEGKAFSIVHFTTRRAGAEAWRLLRAEYARSSGARLGNMVREVVCPRDQWMADESAGKNFLTSWIACEIKVAAYEVASGDRISEAVRSVRANPPETGKCKGKGKDKNKHKGNDGDKSKERDEWNKGQRQAKF